MYIRNDQYIIGLDVLVCSIFIHLIVIQCGSFVPWITSYSQKVRFHFFEYHFELIQRIYSEKTGLEKSGLDKTGLFLRCNQYINSSVTGVVKLEVFILIGK